MAGRFLSMFGPLSRLMPEVSPPARRVGFNEKIFWTAMALVLYLIMGQVDLYRVGEAQGWELTYLRVIFASNRGTLLELGIGPIVTAGLILQLLAGSGMVSCDFTNPDDRGLFTTASKFFSIVMTGVQASAYLIGGVYGPLDPGTSIIIFLQLLTAGIVIMLLDEMIQKGWGIGSGISLFILAGVAQGIFWDSLGPTVGLADGNSYGAFIAIAQIIPRIMTGSNIIVGDPPENYGPWSWSHVFVRPRDPTLPAMLGFITTVAVFLIVIYAEGVRVELPVSYARYRGFRGKYPIKLLYVSNLPVIFASALFANIYFFSQLLWTQPWGRNNFWVNLLGRYTVPEGSTQPQPVGGLVYYVISPRNISEVVSHPERALAFTGIMVAFCIIFSLTWLEVGGLGPRTVAKQLVDAGMQIPGFRRSSRPIELLLKRYIPVVTILGGLIVGLIASVADFFGVFGSGMGVLLSVGILYQYYQLLVQERVAEMYPAFRRLLGG